VWWTDFLAYAPDGGYREPAPPDIASFDGALTLLDIGALADPSVDRPAALANAVRTFAGDVPGDLPLAFTIHWGPLEHVLEISGFCEAEICPSAFTEYF